MSRNRESTIWLFGKPYHWRVVEGVLTLAPDQQLPLPTYWPRTNLVQLYRDLAKKDKGVCSRCGTPVAAPGSIEVDPLCVDCMIALSYSELWRKLDRGE